MSLTVTDLLVPTYRQMLGVLSGWLDKALEQVGEDNADALMAARLAPDMFPLATQVRFCCVQALEGISRPRNESLPPLTAELLEEGRGAGEKPGTLAEAKARIAGTLALLESVSASALDGDSDQPLAHELPNGMVLDLTLGQYARDWALPQFFFHVMTAYAILRSESVPLGKADYVAHLFPFIRPGTIPAS